MGSRIAIDGNGFDIFERSHRGLRHLHVDLVTHTGFGVEPIVGSHEATRSGGSYDRSANIIRSCAELAREHAVYVNVHGGIAKRLFELDIAQFFYLYQFLLNAIGIALDVGILWPGDGDFRGRRRAEVQGLTDEISRVERKMRAGKF